MSYTKDQTARLQEFTEVTYAQAVALGVELDQTTKSIISKVQFLNIPYIKKDVPTPKPIQITKAQYLDLIDNALGESNPGLIGATRDALVALYTNLADRDLT